MTRQNYSPLSLGEPALLHAGVWEKRLVWFPIVGWAIAGFLQIGRIGRAKLDVHRQLRQREHFPADAWTAVGVEPAGAEKVARAIAARIVLPNHHVLPDDSLRLLLLDEDGMGFFEAMYIIEKDLGVKVPPRAVPLEGTFRDLVNLVDQQPAGA